MDFSRPDNARTINRLRVLNALRDNENLTRASLSAMLNLNKVSMSEIVQALVDDRIVIEGDKVTTGNGRPGTSLALSQNYCSAIGIDIQTRSIAISLFNLSAAPLRLERFPRTDLKTPEDIRDAVLKTIDKMLKLSALKPLGMVIAINARIREGRIESEYDEVLTGVNLEELFKESCPFPVIAVPALEAEAEAERFYFRTTLENMLFVNWGEHITSAIILSDRILPNMEFGHLPVAKQNVCYCGSIGCLDTVSSGWGIMAEAARTLGKAMSVRELLKDEAQARPLLMKAAETLAKALVMAIECTGVSAIIIGGGISNLPDEYFAHMMDITLQLLPEHGKDTPIYRSNYKEKGTVQGAGVIALDRFFFNKNVLISLGYVEA